MEATRAVLLFWDEVSSKLNLQGLAAHSVAPTAVLSTEEASTAFKTSDVISTPPPLHDRGQIL